MWMVISFISGLLSAGQVVAVKRVVNDFYPAAITFVAFLLSAAVTAVFAIQEWPLTLPSIFWGWLLIAVIADILGKLLMTMALEDGELSYIGSLRLATPLFVMSFSPLIANQPITTGGFVGVTLITLGLFMIPADGSNSKYLRIRDLITHRSGRLMSLGVVLIALTSTLDVPGIAASSTYTWITIKLLTNCIIMAPFVVRRFRKPNEQRETSAYFYLILSGLFLAFSVVLHFYTITIAPISYVVSIKSVAAILPVVVGYLFLKERLALLRLRGTVLMIIGAIVLQLS